jgi:3-deoxy-manno-octulosonate cytidylyltransferase (CMP-KDO synthetase)
VELTGTHSSNLSQTKAVAIIPARFASSRLPGKVLLEIAGKAMICRVAEQASAARNVGRVIVATDDQRIVSTVEAAGFEAVMTSSDHATGTDRLAEVVAKIDDAEIIVNVQGDEPLISPETIERAVETLRSSATAGIVTTWESIDDAADVLNPAVVKIAMDDMGRALYFSRAPVPWPRDAVHEAGSIDAALQNDPALPRSFRKHTGLYVYRREVVLDFAGWPPSRLERLESLEQLRALEHDVEILAIEASTRSVGVDTNEDLERVRRIVSGSEFRVQGLRAGAQLGTRNSEQETRN